MRTRDSAEFPECVEEVVVRGFRPIEEPHRLGIDHLLIKPSVLKDLRGWNNAFVGIARSSGEGEG